MTLAKYFNITPFNVVASLTTGALLLLLYATTTDYYTQSSSETGYIITNGKVGKLDLHGNSTGTSDGERHRVGKLPYEPNETPLDGSYAGHLPVGNCTANPHDNLKDCGELFYWYFPAEDKNQTDAPLLIWLQGGPGSSSMIGIFYENGPFIPSENSNIIRRKLPWTKSYDMLFIDQPVGTGFSYAESANNTLRFTKDNTKLPANDASSTRPLNFERCHHGGYVTNQQQVTRHFIYFLERFYDMHPHLRKRQLYITGESYAGKFIPSMAHGILRHNQQVNTPRKINLSGLAIGNGLTVPSIQVKYNAQLAANLGLISLSQMATMQKLCDTSSELAAQGNYLEALQPRLQMFDLFNEYTSNVNYYDIREKDIPKERARMTKLLQKLQVMQALNANGHKFHSDKAAKDCLADDIMRSVIDLFPELLNHYPILLFQGQFDFRDGPISSEAWIREIKWPEQKAFNEAPRKAWRISDKPGGLAGYVTERANLTHAVVLNAGHFSPANQPEAILHMLHRWMTKQSIAAA
ncbi:Alpha/Beta hydrolase protein [Syncephalis plumigaleata]|nr:Alpha/Beta hydrolase protein [Syncephalis plumigaleata]